MKFALGVRTSCCCGTRFVGSKLIQLHLPKSTVLRNVFDLRKNRCSEETLKQRRTPPQVQLFPYLSNSKHWALFIIEKKDTTFTLRKVMPETYHAKAFEHVTKQLTAAYDPQFTHETTWQSSRGLDTLFVYSIVEYLQPSSSAVQRLDVAHWVPHITDVMTTGVTCIDEMRRIRIPFCDHDSVARRQF